jgi:hypothetical protein
LREVRVDLRRVKSSTVELEPRGLDVETAVIGKRLQDSRRQASPFLVQPERLFDGPYTFVEIQERRDLGALED